MIEKPVKPIPAVGTWIQNFIAECEAFPRGKHDEQVDELCGIMDNRNVAQKLAYR